MDIAEKVQKFVEVASGKAEVKEIQTLIADDDPTNFIKLGVDHMIAQAIAAKAAHQSEFRFRLLEKDRETFSDWHREESQFSAPMLMGQIRLKFPQAIISVERR